MHILQSISGHDDLVRLNDADRKQLCQEIREFLIASVSKTGGHLASNLGTVELSVAIETVFNTMEDRLVFDVGHQSYVHKLLTGRQADFEHLRQFGGMSGFPKPHESDSDAFVAGHASSSVSIALGMARARTLQKQNYHVIALIGDGAATGGMAYEGLNDASASKEPMVIILNDNEMSIDRNVGGLARHLSKTRASTKYLKFKKQYREAVKKLPGGAAFYNFSSNLKNRVKRALLPWTIFENMGLNYYGPVDGHDLPELIRLLKEAKNLHAPVVVHVVTRKGCGYEPAEANPAKFHGIGKFDPISGETLSAKVPTFSEAFGDAMISLAAENPRICAITAAMASGTGLLKFRDQFPKRTFDVGIAEEHAVSMAGGLAKQGMIPVVAIYSTFLQRSYDQIMQDVALLGLHVVFAIDRAGLVGDDGETHHGVFDVGFLRQVPGMTVLAPASRKELADMLAWAVNECTGPVAVRYPRGGEGAVTESAWNPDSGVVTCRRGSDGVIITYGTLVNQVLEAARQLSEQAIEVSVLRLTRVDPVALDDLKPALAGMKRVLIAEEATAGLAQSLAWQIHQMNPDCRIETADLGDEFVVHGSQVELYKKHGLDAASIAERFMGVLKK